MGDKCGSAGGDGGCERAQTSRCAAPLHYSTLVSSHPTCERMLDIMTCRRQCHMSNFKVGGKSSFYADGERVKLGAGRPILWRKSRLEM